ncbi:MAG: hypothetical protein K0R28_5303 [Paenibacillus sp.]|nr:hypothetical protein [Paenibacillus sp.]
MFLPRIGYGSGLLKHIDYKLSELGIRVAHPDIRSTVATLLQITAVRKIVVQIAVKPRIHILAVESSQSLWL